MEPNKKSLPLATIVLIAYNQEDYIEEAINGAFSQTYTNLQIILSDDCSTDDTYKIIQKMANAYNGPHSVITNRNDKNLGIAAHCNHLFNLADGEFIILAAGDDISEKERVATSVEIWLTSNRKINSVFSNLEKINSQSTSLGLMFSTPPNLARNINDYKSNISCWVVGASFSFEKKIFSNYGPINPKVCQEDGVLAFRAILDGEIFYYEKPLVKYRFHSSNVSQSNDPARRLRLQQKEYYLKKNRLADAMLYSQQDKKLIYLLRTQCLYAYAQHLFFSIPALGYAYNYLRIKAKLILK